MSPKLRTATTSTAMNTVRLNVFQIADLGNSHSVLIVGTSRRFVLHLDSRLLWAGSFCLMGGFDGLRDLHVRLDRQMIGKCIACCVDAMWRVIDGCAIDGCKSSLNRPST